MRRIAMTLFVLGVAVGATEARAQGPDEQVSASASIVIPQVLKITVSNATVTFPQATASHFEAGLVAPSSGASVVETRGNVAHDVEIQAAGDFFQVGGVDSSKPATDFQWSVDGGSSWAGLSSSAVDIATNLARGVHGGGSPAATVDYQMLLNESTDSPATYSLAFTYTVVAN